MFEPKNLFQVAQVSLFPRVTFLHVLSDMTSAYPSLPLIYVNFCSLVSSQATFSPVSHFHPLGLADKAGAGVGNTSSLTLPLAASEGTDLAVPPAAQLVCQRFSLDQNVL